MRTIAIVPRIVNHSVVSIGIARLNATKSAYRKAVSRRRGEILFAALAVNLAIWILSTLPLKALLW